MLKLHSPQERNCRVRYFEDALAVLELEHPWGGSLLRPKWTPNARPKLSWSKWYVQGWATPLQQIMVALWSANCLEEYAEYLYRAPLKGSGQVWWIRGEKLAFFSLKPVLLEAGNYPNSWDLQSLIGTEFWTLGNSQIPWKSGNFDIRQQNQNFTL